MKRSTWKVGGWVAAVVAVAVVGMTPTPSLADGSYPQNGLVSEAPIWQSPRLLDGTVLAISQTGNRVFVGGNFTRVRNFQNGSPEISRAGLFAFNATTGLIDTSFVPVLEGNVRVNEVDVSADGEWLYVGGLFTISGRRNLVRLSTNTGALDTGFRANANKSVNDIKVTGSRVIVAGAFQTIQGVTRERLAAVDATTGAVDPALNLPITVARDGNPTQVNNLDISEDGHWLVIAGAFREVAGAYREQVAVIDLATNPVSLADWSTPRYAARCSSVTSGTYTQDVAISPDSTYFVVVHAGAFFANTLCDTTARFELNQTGSNVQPTWITYTGGDTLKSAFVTNDVIHVGGHERWQNNPNPSPRGDNDGPGSVARTGISALDPLTGVPLAWNPTRARGVGVQAYHANDQYLYVGSDTETFNGQQRHRLAVLPVGGGTQNPPPDTVSLPVDVYVARTDGTMYQSTFDGLTIGGFAAFSGPGIDGINWSQVRGAFVQRDQLVTYDRNSAYYRRSFDGTTLGSETNLSTSVGYVDTTHDLTPHDQPFNVDTTRAVAYKDGRLFYTRSNDTRLWWRWYSIQSGIIGAQEFVAASGIDWRGATGLEIAGNWLYASWNNNTLLRFFVSGPIVQTGTQTIVDNGATSGIPWNATRDFAFIASDGSGHEPPPPPPPEDIVCPAGQWRAEYYQGIALGGPVDTVRCETDIDNNWGTGSPPGTGVGPDQFSVRWNMTLAVPTADTYTFTATTDDGMRVFVDGTPVIDQWHDQGPTTYVANVDLSAGDHAVRVEYYENGGGSVARMLISAPSPGCPAGQWQAEYYANMTLAGTPVTVRCEAVIDNDWGDGSPPDSGVGPDQFSVRWTTNLSVPTAATYTFTVTTDDGMRVFADGTAVIDQWHDQAPTTYTGNRLLAAGNHPVRVEFYENGGGATARVTIS